MATAGLSSLGVTFGYGVETTAGTAPASYKTLTRINAIGGISIEAETIDASALEDLITRNIAGRSDTGGTFNVTVNITPETTAEWTALIAEYKALGEGLKMHFQTTIPDLGSFFVVAQPPAQIPQPEVGQNELLTADFPLTIEEYLGFGETV